MIWSQAARAYLATFERVLQPTITSPTDPSDRHGSSNGASRATRGTNRSSPLDVRQHRPAAARRAWHPGPLTRLLCRRQCARLARRLHSCGAGEARLPETLTTRFAAFVQHAWNPDTRRFRNFMSYDRRWLEDQGSEDSHGRTLWALAVCAPRTAIRREGHGRRRSSRRRCLLLKHSLRHAPGHSRCSRSMPIARRQTTMSLPTACAAILADRLMTRWPRRSRSAGCGSRMFSPTTMHACRRP